MHRYLTVSRFLKSCRLPLLLWIASPTNSLADIITDGSVGSAINLSGPHFTVGQDLGSRLGGNLFHSFSRFNLSSAESATFTGAADIQNVISRVTGGTVSAIDGTLKSEVGLADFYFINPAGIVFGANAQVDVPAAFYASTAAELKFADGTTFSAVNPDNSQLSMATPDSFGFLQNQTGKISINGSQLQFKPGATAQFSSQSLQIEQARIEGAGMQLQLVANGSQQRDIDIKQLTNQALGGDINIQQSHIESSGIGSEQLVIRGGHTSIKNSFLNFSNFGVSDHSDSLAVDIHVDRLQLTDNSVISSAAYFKGAPGDIHIQADGALALLNGSSLLSATLSSGDAADILIDAAEITFEGSKDQPSGIASSTINSGHAGSITINSQGRLALGRNTLIDSSTAAAGNAGDISITAGDIVLNGEGGGLAGISSSAYIGTGHAGNVSINSSGKLSLLDGGQIHSSTASQGNGGSVEVLAGEIEIDNKNSVQNTGIFASSAATSTGNAGKLSISSQKRLTIVNGGQISSSTFSTGDAGSVTVDAGELVIDGQGYTGFLTGIASQANSGSEGQAGTVKVTSTGLVKIVDGGRITSNTFAKGDAGSVVVSGGEIFIDKDGSALQTGIFSQASGGLSKEDAVGNGGTVTVTSDGLLAIVNGGEISSSTFTAGDAGSVNVEADVLFVDSEGYTEFITGISSLANPGSVGHAGPVSVTARRLLGIVNGGEISSSTFSVGNASTVTINAENMIIDGQNSAKVTGVFSQANPGASGIAGTVQVETNGLLSLINGGRIRTSTFSSGKAGNVTVNAGQLTIDGQGNRETDIGSQAFGSSGDAGNVTVTSQGLLSIMDGGKITSSTGGLGNAGSVTVKASGLLLDGDNALITSSADNIFSGRVGSVSVDVGAGEIVIRNGGKISISSAAVLPETLSLAAEMSFFAAALETSVDTSVNIRPSIDITADSLSLQGGEITAESTGNVAASDITIHSNRFIMSGLSRITTTAQNGDGGAVSVNAGRYALLQDSQLTTSVFGLSGDGGDIAMSTPVLILNGGFIQANTAAVNAVGGNIDLVTDALIPEGNLLSVGGDQVFSFEPGSGVNVIQAAAPDGVSGIITNTSPELNIAGTLAGIETPSPDLERVGRDPCSSTVQQNTLKTIGRGAATGFLKGQQQFTVDKLMAVQPQHVNIPEEHVDHHSQLLESDLPDMERRGTDENVNECGRRLQNPAVSRLDSSAVFGPSDQ